ncbi:MAG: hypothetical protein NC346_09050 [Prevotella sp.]|nr:hypothetical protein [Prevotella sp.]MCM1443669.1 hypothetical protein [Muribaculum sp.]
MMNNPCFLQAAGNVQKIDFPKKYIAIESAINNVYMTATGGFSVMYKKNGKYCVESYEANQYGQTAVYVDADANTEIRVTAITNFSCKSNQLTKFVYNGGKYGSLVGSLTLSNNRLTELDLTYTNDAGQLGTVSVQNNLLTSLKLPANGSDFYYLNCSGNLLKELDLSVTHSISTVYCNDNNIERIIPPIYSSLRTLIAYNNKLAEFDVKEVYKYIHNLELHKNNIAGIPDFSNISHLIDLKIHNNNLNGIVLPAVQNGQNLIYNNPFLNNEDELRVFIDALPNVSDLADRPNLFVNENLSENAYFIDEVEEVKGWNINYKS